MSTFPYEYQSKANRVLASVSQSQRLITASDESRKISVMHYESYGNLTSTHIRYQTTCHFCFLSVSYITIQHSHNIIVIFIILSDFISVYKIILTNDNQFIRKYTYIYIHRIIRRVQFNVKN